MSPHLYDLKSKPKSYYLEDILNIITAQQTFLSFKLKKWLVEMIYGPKDAFENISVDPHQDQNCKIFISEFIR
jgi:hypothetical protein